MSRNITISIVNHGHCEMVLKLLRQLSSKCTNIETIIITNNLQPKLQFDKAEYSFKLIILNNVATLGFAQNHNKAFKLCETEYFCIMNPDIEISKDPYPILVSGLQHSNIDVVAPKVCALDGSPEDSARYFPTPLGLIKKLIFNDKGVYDLDTLENVHYPDWVAGMFILCRSEFYHRLNGFDEKFFLYYEDIDFCLRARKLGSEIALFDEVNVFHDAQRSSHRDFKLFLIHLKSMVRFFIKHLFRFPVRSN